MGYYKDNATAPSWAKETPIVYNLTMTDAETEYSQVLPVGCKGFSVSIQGGTAADIFSVSFIPSGTPLKYPGDVEYFEDGLNLTGTLYLKCVTAGKVAQILVWI